MSGPAPGDGVYSVVGSGVSGLFGEGVGDGGSGTLMQDDYGTYAEIKSIGGCPAIPHACLGRLAGVEGVSA